MPDISITDFTDFVLKVGGTKITKVTELKKRGEYDPRTDYWKLLRDSIRDFHEGKLEALSFGATGAHSRKETSYRDAIKGYKKFLNANPGAWFRPHPSEWHYEDLRVRVNPEVGLETAEKRLLLKLYFRKDKLTSSRVQVLLALMSEANKNPSLRVGIVDVLRSRVYLADAKMPAMQALLIGEATTFLSIWNSL